MKKFPKKIFLFVSKIVDGELKEFETLYRNLIENIVFLLGGKIMIKLTKFN